MGNRRAVKVLRQMIKCVRTSKWQMDKEIEVITGRGNKGLEVEVRRVEEMRAKV